MEYLMNGAFYRFLTSLSGSIFFKHFDFIFDWIPVQERMQLIKLLDTYQAAQMRLTWLRGTNSDSDVIDRASQEDEECRQLFKSALKKAYQEAEKLADMNSSHGIYEAPEPDLEFWRQVHNRELYEARLAAGEPVVFYKGRSCLYGSFVDYRDAVVPGPYPGLQYYHFYDNACSPDECRFWQIAQGEKNCDWRMQEDPLPMGYGSVPCHVKRQRLLEKRNIIGPATYAEFVKQNGFYEAMDLADDHWAQNKAREAEEDYWHNVIFRGK